jgi:hypothetical protein
MLNTRNRGRTSASNGFAVTRTQRAAFFDAASQADGEVITLRQLMESMFDLGFLDVSDMRWRTPTKTFRKNGE